MARGIIKIAVHTVYICVSGVTYNKDTITLSTPYEVLNHQTLERGFGRFPRNNAIPQSA